MRILQSDLARSQALSEIRKLESAIVDSIEMLKRDDISYDAVKDYIKRCLKMIDEQKKS